MKIKSIKAITLSMPFSHGGKKVIFHGKEWKSLEFNLVKIETAKGISNNQAEKPIKIYFFFKTSFKIGSQSNL